MKCMSYIENTTDVFPQITKIDYNRIHVICDIDNVLNNLTEAVVNRINYDFNTNHNFKNMTNYAFWECINIKKDSMYFLYFRNPLLWKTVDVLNIDMSSVEFIDILNGICNLSFVSACTVDIGMYKSEFMHKNFPQIPEESINYMHDKTIITCDILIDDYFGNFNGDNYKKGILLTHPWNEHIDISSKPNVVRVSTFSEIIEIVKEYSRIKNKTKLDYILL